MLLFDEELMTFTMGNCITLEDTNGNRKLLKKRYDQKIDAVAAMMEYINMEFTVQNSVISWDLYAILHWTAFVILMLI